MPVDCKWFPGKLLHLSGMKRLVIKEFGPIREADMELRKINAVIGPQSSCNSPVAVKCPVAAWERGECDRSHEKW